MIRAPVAAARSISAGLRKHEAAAAERAAAAAQAAARLAPPAFAWDDDGLDEASNRVVDVVHEGKLDEAEQAARDLLVGYPDVHDGFERLAMVYEARGDRKQAAEYYRKALAFMRENARTTTPKPSTGCAGRPSRWSRIAEG